MPIATTCLQLRYIVAIMLLCCSSGEPTGDDVGVKKLGSGDGVALGLWAGARWKDSCGLPSGKASGDRCPGSAFSPPPVKLQVITLNV